MANQYELCVAEDSIIKTSKISHIFSLHVKISDFAGSNFDNSDSTVVELSMFHVEEKMLIIMSEPGFPWINHKVISKIKIESFLKPIICLVEGVKCEDLIFNKKIIAKNNNIF